MKTFEADKNILTERKAEKQMGKEHRKIVLLGIITAVCLVFAGFHIKYLKEKPFNKQFYLDLP